MSNKNKRVVSGKDNPFNKIETDSFTSNLSLIPEGKQIYLCSFCKRELPDESTLFREIHVCPTCLNKWLKLISDLLACDLKREAKYGIR